MKNYKLLLPGVTFAIGPVLAYISLPFVTHNVNISEYGVYTYYLSLLSIISFLSLLPALNATVNRYGSKISETYSVDMYSFKVLYFISFFVFLFCVLTVNYFYEDIKGADFIVISASILCINIFNVLKSYLLINNEKLRYSFFVILINISQYSYLFYAINNEGFDVTDVLFGNVILLLAVILFNFKVIVYFIKSKPKIVAKNTKILKFVFMSFVISLSTIIYNNTDKIMMDFILDEPSTLALYQVSYQIFSFPIESVYTLISIFTPAFLYRAFDRNKKLYLGNLIITFKVVLFIIFNLSQFLFINKNFLKSLLLDSNYIVDDSLPMLFLVSQSLFVIYLISANIFIVHDKRIYIIISLALSSILNVGLNYFLISSFGYVGAALSTLISYIVLIILISFLSYRIFKFKIFDRKDVLYFASIPVVYYLFGENYIVWMSVLVVISFLYFKANIKNTYLTLLRGV
jgi:O-antigen/teichoic acid export membrane protein